MLFYFERRNVLLVTYYHVFCYYVLSLKYFVLYRSTDNTRCVIFNNEFYTCVKCCLNNGISFIHSFYSNLIAKQLSFIVIHSLFTTTKTMSKIREHQGSLKCNYIYCFSGHEIYQYSIHFKKKVQRNCCVLQTQHNNFAFIKNDDIQMMPTRPF